MRRIKVVLAATAAMAVLMVMTAAPAFADIELGGSSFSSGGDIEFSGPSINTGGGTNVGGVENQQFVLSDGFLFGVFDDDLDDDVGDVVFVV